MIKLGCFDRKNANKNLIQKFLINTLKSLVQLDFNFGSTQLTFESIFELLLNFTDKKILKLCNDEEAGLPNIFEKLIKPYILRYKHSQLKIEWLIGQLNSVIAKVELQMKN